MKSGSLISALALIAVAVLPVSHSAAQGLEIGELTQAQAFEPGAADIGGGALSSNLWTGTSADTAEVLIDALPENYSNPVARSLARRVLLSAGAPPLNDADNSYPVTRMNGIIRLSEMAAAQDIAARSPGLASSEVLKADLALLSGDMSAACQKSDSVIEGRSEPYWMKLRALCHIERSESAAADVTLDLLRNAGEQDPYFERLLRHMTGVPGTPDLAGIPATPLHIAMMGQAGLEWPSGKKPAVAAAQTVFNASVDDATRLAALLAAGPALSDAQIVEIIDSFAPQNTSADTGLVGSFAGLPAEPNLDTATADKSAKGFYQLHNLAQLGDSNTRLGALIALLRRADQGGGFDRFVRLMTPQLQIIDYTDARGDDLPLLTRAAIVRSDLGALQQIYGALEGNPPAQERIALAADALGNGFFGGNLGTDIDMRLTKPGKKNRALRDAMLAHALGANLSEPALSAISEKAFFGQTSGNLFAFELASRKQTIAETALRAAQVLEARPDGNLSDFVLYKVVSGLYQAGLTDEASRLAALDFIQDFPG